MKKRAFFCLVSFALSACTNEQLYRALGSPDPQGQPFRYPLDYPICPDGGRPTLFPALAVKIYSQWIPFPDELMAKRKRDPNADGCRPPRPGNPTKVFMPDWFNASSPWWLGIDKSGNGYFTSTGYKNQLLNAKYLKQEEDERKIIAQWDIENLAKRGHVQVEVIEKENTVIINGLTWRYRRIGYYDSTDLHDVSHAKFVSWHEVYEHNIDDSHVFRFSARYDASVIADPIWLKARRDLLLQLVKTVYIEPMTPAEVDAAIAEYYRQHPPTSNPIKK